MKKIIFLSLVLFFSGSSAYCQISELWGTNRFGGADNNGRIISLNPLNNNVSEVHGFPTSYPGASLERNKMIAFDNHLYGITMMGGIYNLGVIFKYDPVTNKETKLHEFDYYTTGGYPVKGLTILNSKMYGITNTGGANGIGVIFEFDPVSNVFIKKIDLSSATGGGNPESNLTAWNGKLYAVTNSGYTNNRGAIIEYDPVSNTCVPKLALTNNSSVGRMCFTGLTLLNNKFYGSMSDGAPYGLIFEWDPATNVYLNKYTLSSTTPYGFTGSFTAAGNVLYATPNSGPNFSSQSTLVEFDPATSTLVTKVSFTNASGGYGSYADLEFYNNKYYGTNITGSSSGYGSFFEWDPVTNIITQRINATTGIGAMPASSFTLLNGNLYTTCRYMNQNGTGPSTMVEWNTSNSTVTRKFVFGVNEGKQVDSRPVFYNGKVYGVTTYGGANDKGVIFSKDVNTGEYSVLHNFVATAFSDNTQSQPNLYNGKLYGSVKAAVSGNYGTIWEFDIASGTYSERYNLSLSTGFNIKGSMPMVNNLLYGISTSGGNNSLGTIFSWNPVTNAYTILAQNAGYVASGGFIEHGGFLYAATNSNGSSTGSILRLNPANNVITVAASFSSVGEGAIGEFCMYNNKLYITTYSGGANAAGAIIEFNPANNQVIRLKEFDAAYPTGSANGGAWGIGNLVVYNNFLYGMTAAGGLNGVGTVFRFDPSTNQYLKIEDIPAVDESGGTDYGNGFTLIQKGTVVPVLFSNFDARKLNKFNAELLWTTSTELNNKGFSIQRSFNGIHFENIGWVNGMNSTNGNTYSFIDIAPLKGNNYYRIEQVDFDQHKMYTTTRILNFADFKVNIYPNPVAEILSVSNGSDKKGILRIFETNGKLVRIFSVNEGINQFNISSVSKGTYLYQLIIDGSFNTGKIEKL